MVAASLHIERHEVEAELMEAGSLGVPVGEELATHAGGELSPRVSH